MRYYDLHEAARLDILSLVEVVAGGRADAEGARDALTDALVECFERLAEFPELGRARPVRSGSSRTGVAVWFVPVRSNE